MKCHMEWNCGAITAITDFQSFPEYFASRWINRLPFRGFVSCFKFVVIMPSDFWISNKKALASDWPSIACLIKNVPFVFNFIFESYCLVPNRWERGNIHKGIFGTAISNTISPGFPGNIYPTDTKIPYNFKNIVCSMEV